MAKKVRFLTTSAGDYGLANTDDELVVSDSVADKLEEAGTVKVLGKAGDDEVAKPDKGSIRIDDQTGSNKPSTKPAAKKGK